MEELSSALNEKMHAIGDLADRAASLGAELDICRCQLAAAHAENGTLREQLAEAAKQQERLENDIGRMKSELQTVEANRERSGKLRKCTF